MSYNNLSNINPENLELEPINVVPTHLLPGKMREHQAKIGDILSLHTAVASLESAINRTLRIIKREINVNNNRINQLGNEMNQALQTMSEHIDLISNPHIPHTSHKTPAPQISISTGINPNPSLNDTPRHNFFGLFQNQDNRPVMNFERNDRSISPNRTNNSPPRSPTPNPNDEQSDDENPTLDNQNSIFTLTFDPIISHIGIYNGDSQKTFESWSRKFLDYVEASGANWDDAQKLGRLKLLLDGSPRQILEELPDNQKDTLAHAIENLKNTIDSPQRKDLAKQTLSTCRQKDNETIQAFAERLIPLVNASVADPNVRRERLCDLFLEKINEEISFLVRLTGQHTNFENARTKALEIENMLAHKKSLQNTSSVKVITTNSNLIPIPQSNQNSNTNQNHNPSQTTNQNPTNFPQGQYSNWTPVQSQHFNRQPQIQQQGRNRWPNQRFNNNRNNFVPNNRPNQFNNNIRRNNNQQCYYCHNMGHVMNECRKRMRAMQNNANFAQPPNRFGQNFFGQPLRFGQNSRPERKNQVNTLDQFNPGNPENNNAESTTMDQILDMIKNNVNVSQNPTHTHLMPFPPKTKSMN